MSKFVACAALAGIVLVAGYALASGAAGQEATPTPIPTPIPTPVPTIPPGDAVTAEQMREWYPCPYDVDEFPESCEVYAVLWLGWPGLYAVEGPEPIATPEPARTPVPTPTMAAALPKTGGF